MSIFWKVILERFIKGALAAAIPLLTVTVTNWKDLEGFLSGLGVALIFGGISGLILATDKALRWETKKKK